MCCTTRRGGGGGVRRGSGGGGGGVNIILGYDTFYLLNTMTSTKIDVKNHNIEVAYILHNYNKINWIYMRTYIW